MNRTVIASVLSLHYLGYMCTAPHIVGDVASVFFGKILYINDGRRVKQSSESEGTELRLFFGALRGRIPFVILNYTCLRFLIYTQRHDDAQLSHQLRDYKNSESTAQRLLLR